jgi:acyl-CoA thioester hydrolase
MQPCIKLISDSNGRYLRGGHSCIPPSPLRVDRSPLTNPLKGFFYCCAATLGFIHIAQNRLGLPFHNGYDQEMEPHASSSPTFRYTLTVPPAAIDANGHANNVEFVRWMQEAAVAHSDAVGCTSATTVAGAMWVVRSHKVEYRKAALAGDILQIVTWIHDFRRAFSRRKYRFERAGDGVVLAEGETEWVFVDTATGRPRSIPAEIVVLFATSDRA